MPTRLAVLSVSTACLLMAPVAAADPTHLDTFHLHGSNGYRIRVDASPSPGSVIPGHKPFALNKRKGAATVTVSKGRASSAYSVPATVTRTRIKARLRGFGRIAVKFHVHAVNVVVPTKRETICLSGQVTTVGTFRGRIRFRGEHGYTQVKARRAPGGIGYQESHCSGTPSDQTTELIARSPTTRLLALRDTTYGLTGFIASERVKRGRVLINRSAVRIGRKANEFRFDDGLTSCHVEPLGPLFSGSADFTAPGTWTGPLTASFPGEADAPMTGPDFTARLKSVLLKRSNPWPGPKTIAPR